MYYKKIVGNNISLSPSDIEHEIPIMTKWLNEDEDIPNNNHFYVSLLGVNKVKELLEKWNEAHICLQS